jgi:hypothetical protein
MAAEMVIIGLLRLNGIGNFKVDLETKQTLVWLVLRYLNLRVFECGWC